MFEKYFFNIIHYCQLVTYRIEFDPNGTKCLGHYPSCWKQHLEASKGKVFQNKSNRRGNYDFELGYT